MNIVQLTQGTPEWLAHRASYFNASDAPAMMGVSPYKTRAALIREMATGLAEDVTADKQRLFDAGHRFEALARPLAEQIIGEELSPVVGTDGALSASFDGLTFMGDVAFEHKTLNDSLRAAIRQQGGNANDFLAPPYRVQMEQQCIVSGCERILFMASKWDGDTLVEERHCWYTPDAELRAQILAGWEQFEKDVAAYVPTEAPEPAKAEAMDHLPAVSVRLDGALSVAGNLPMFAEALKAFIAKIPPKPATDNDFATVDAACKALKKAEEALDAAEAGALASITDVEAMRRAVAECRKLARDTRLASEKLVERRKAEVKEQAVVNARRALDDHIAALNAELAPMRLQPVAADFAAAIKGLRSIASMQDALDTTLANGKIAADGQARAIRANIATFKAQAAGMEFLFSDLGAIVHKAADDFATLVTARVEKHKADEARRLEQERERIRAEEAARLEREQREEAERQARELAEAHARAKAAEAAQNSEAQTPQQVLKAEPETADATDRGVSVITSPSVGSMGARATADAAPSVAPAPEVSAFHPAAAALREQPTMTLGQISTRLGFTVTADFLAGLGFEAHKEKASRLYPPSWFPSICTVISVHVLLLGSEAKKAA